MPYTLLPDEEQPRGFRLLDDAPAPKADPQIGQPEELSFAEKYIAPILDKLGGAAQRDTGAIGAVSRAVLNNGNARGSEVGRLAMGAADPGFAIAQIVANATGNGDAVNKGITDTEKKYQAARAEAGSTGFDPLRVGGAIGMSALIPGMAGAGSGVVRGAAIGAASGALEPVLDAGPKNLTSLVTGNEPKDFWKEKLKQVGIGAAGGAVLSPIMGALARVISPKASTDETVKLLQSEGVQPTIGQALGGIANRIEEKLTSLPIMGDRISAMRNKAIDQFNEAAINRSVAPIGERVKGFGQEAVAEAGDKLSAVYNDALKSVNHVGFDTPQFNAKFGELQDMATGLINGLDKKFDSTLKNVVLKRMSPNGSISGADLKKVDSELGQIAAKWQGSSTASEKEFGDAIKQLQAILKERVAEAHPDVAARLAAADKGWANLVRVEGAAGRAVNNEGRFTPAQLNGAIKAADRSTRDRATARGEALMQDLGNAGSRLGNRVADSGTPTRLAWGGGALAAGGLSPAIPGALIAGAGAYTPPVQNALRYLLTQRPDMAPAVANYLRQLASPAALAAGPLIAQGSQ